MGGLMGFPRVSPCILLVCALYWGSLSILSALADEPLPAAPAPVLGRRRGPALAHKGGRPRLVARGKKRAEQKNAEAEKPDNEETSVSQSRTEASFFLENEDALPGSFLGIVEHDAADVNEPGFPGDAGTRKAKVPMKKNNKGKRQRGNKKAPGQGGKGAAAPGGPPHDGPQAAGALPHPGRWEARPQDGRLGIDNATPGGLFLVDEQDQLGMAKAPGASDAVVVEESALGRPASKRRPFLSRDSALTLAPLLPLVTAIFCFFAYRTLSPIAKRMGRERRRARGA
ncbi:putative transmembrane protein [Toxoplasma gondii MAS]|uniref:Putative transmembrane protein n=2 Tax=Toxoplasma gondii TaxID=5811 RepID=A0A086PW62_TOXGO|nr:putative transmembrane protein [Toxoplasma gondii MAS]PUA84674.1 putative transmembrane protein [Toxoplasma gondii TgCATBr9]